MLYHYQERGIGLIFLRPKFIIFLSYLFQPLVQDFLFLKSDFFTITFFDLSQTAKSSTSFCLLLIFKTSKCRQPFNFLFEVHLELSRLESLFCFLSRLFIINKNTSFLWLHGFFSSNRNLVFLTV